MTKNDEGRQSRLAEMNARGEFELVDPLDYLILKALPDEGELVMNYYPMTKTVKQLVVEDLPGMKSSQMVGPVRRLAEQKLIVNAGGRNLRENAYQRSSLGKKVLREWEKRHTTKVPPKSPDAESGG